MSIHHDLRSIKGFSKIQYRGLVIFLQNIFFSVPDHVYFFGLAPCFYMDVIDKL